MGCLSDLKKSDNQLDKQNSRRILSIHQPIWNSRLTVFKVSVVFEMFIGTHSNVVQRGSLKEEKLDKTKSLSFVELKVCRARLIDHLPTLPTITCDQVNTE